MENQIMPLNRKDVIGAPLGAEPPLTASAKPDQPAAEASAQTQPQAPIEPPKRLLIEEIGQTGRYVYKVVDGISGKVITQIPREELVGMKDQDGYASGALFQTRA